MTPANEKKGRGRPKAFDHEDALDRALDVFWQRGYEGASLSELTEAMAINRPSLYASFGNKEELFRKALEKYLSGPVAYVITAMSEPTARKAAETLLVTSAEFLTNPDHPAGCMIAIGALFGGKESTPIQQTLRAYRKGYEDALRQRFELARQQGDLPRETDPAALAKYVVTIHQGMSVQATSGATKEELLAVIRLALGNWPTPAATE